MPCAVQVLRETDPSSVTEHGLYERPVDKMPDEVRALSCINQSSACVMGAAQHCVASLSQIRIMSKGQAGTQLCGVMCRGGVLAMSQS